MLLHCTEESRCSAKFEKKPSDIPPFYRSKPGQDDELECEETEAGCHGGKGR